MLRRSNTLPVGGLHTPRDLPSATSATLEDGSVSVDAEDLKPLLCYIIATDAERRLYDRTAKEAHGRPDPAAIFEAAWKEVSKQENWEKMLQLNRQFEQILEKVDVDGNGKIDWQEFHSMATHLGKRRRFRPPFYLLAASDADAQREGSVRAAGRSRQQVRDEDEKRAGSDDLKHVLKFYDDGMKEIWNM